MCFLLVLSQDKHKTHASICPKLFKSQKLLDILLKIDRSDAPYELTKPFHSSQKVVEKLSDGSVIIKMQVYINFELERLILGFGESIEVVAPRMLRKRIKKKLGNAFKLYMEKGLPKINFA